MSQQDDSMNYERIPAWATTGLDEELQALNKESNRPLSCKFMSCRKSPLVEGELDLPQEASMQITPFDFKILHCIYYKRQVEVVSQVPSHCDAGDATRDSQTGKPRSKLPQISSPRLHLHSRRFITTCDTTIAM